MSRDAEGGDVAVYAGLALLGFARWSSHGWRATDADDRRLGVFVTRAEAVECISNRYPHGHREVRPEQAS